MEEKLLGTVITRSQGPMRIIGITEEANKTFFACGRAKEGTLEIISRGNFYINEFAIPKDEDAFRKDWPKGFTVNEAMWLSNKDGKWQVGRDSFASYADAALATAENLPAGLELRIYDLDGDGFADRIDADFLEAIIADEILTYEDGSKGIRKLDPDRWLEKIAAEGRRFDGSHFGSEQREHVKPENFDPSIQEGDCCLFALYPDGWKVIPAIAANGILVTGQDHEYYQIDDTKYGDAMRFSRDHIIISNRCGEYVNAMRYFGLLNNQEGLKVTLWIVPVIGYPAKIGATAGFTSGANADAFLTRAISVAKQKLAAAAISPDGQGVSGDWATREACDEISETIKKAEGVLASEAPADMKDYMVYLLYLSLNGVGHDIGAMFGGYHFTGLNATEPMNPAKFFGGHGPGGHGPKDPGEHGPKGSGNHGPKGPGEFESEGPESRK